MTSRTPTTVSAQNNNFHQNGRMHLDNDRHQKALEPKEQKHKVPDHGQWLRSLDRQQRTQLTEKSDRIGLQYLFVHAGLIAAVSGLIVITAWPLWALLPLMVLQGVLLVFLFTLQHETTHYTPFKTRHLNTWVGYACGLLLLLPPVWFRYFHLAHHRWTQNLAKDPELQSPKPDTRLQYLLYLSGLPLWKSLILTLLRNARGRCTDSFVPCGKQPSVRRESQLMLSVYVVVLLLSVITGSLNTLLTVWVIPLLLGQPFLRAYLLAEHADCPEVDNRFANTRTLLTHPLVRRLAWNMPYHTEHHVYPAVPFFRLPQAHALAKAHLQQVEPGYQSFHRRYYQRVSQ
jgi:fatty acid desaturase